MRQSGLEVNFRLQRGGFELALNERFELDGVTVLFGPNGSGKSMSLRTIAGLEPEAMGRVKFNDQVWQDTTAAVFMPTHKRPVTLVFQDARLFAHLDVAGNLRFAERRARRDGPAVARDDVIDAFEIGHLLTRQPAGLSGGERQRVVMARALLSRPSLILMDEPLAALDVQRRAQALSFIEQIPERFSIPLVYVTHQIDEVVRLASQLVLIANGKVEAQGPAADLMARLDLPPFTGRFEAGSLIEARITAQDDAFMLTTVELEPGLEMQVPRLDYGMGEMVRLRVRARDVSLASSVPRGLSLRNVLPATVEEVQLEPDTAFAEVRLSVGNQALRARITRAAAHELKLRPGRKVRALVKAIALDRRLLARR